MGRGGGAGGSRSAGSSHTFRSSSHSSSGRSSASFSSGRSRGYGGSSSSRSSSSTRSSFGTSRAQVPYEEPRRTGSMWGRVPLFAWMPRRSYYGGGYGDPYGGGYGTPYRRTGCGCLSTTTLFLLAVLLVVVMITGSCMRTMTSSSHVQTEQGFVDLDLDTQTEASARQKLAAADCIESSEWIDDQANWIENQDTVIAKMRTFYEKTGVQPYLIIADQVNGSKDYTVSDVERYLRNRYDELFNDDGHLILFFCEAYENEYDPYLLVGSKAATVVDQSAENIIYEAIDRWYTDSSLDDDAYFARIFLASGDAIMNGTNFSEFD